METQRAAASDSLVIRDRAGCIWPLAAGFLTGGLVVASLLLGAGNGPVPTGLVRVGAWAIALAHILVGGGLLFGTPSVTARLDLSERVLSLTHTWVFRRTTRRLHVTEIAEVLMRTMRDSDGDAVYALELRLRTGETIPLHPSRSLNEPELEVAREKLRVWSGGQLVFRGAGSPMGRD